MPRSGAASGAIAANAAALEALIKVLLGDKSGIWEPTRRQPDYRRMPIVG
jgi:hypothetical protein